ncbi:MAG: hypothetical protein AAFV71_25635 [Cyanobacteria bacterium J06633_8]
MTVSSTMTVSSQQSAVSSQQLAVTNQGTNQSLIPCFLYKSCY